MTTISASCPFCGAFLGENDEHAYTVHPYNGALERCPAEGLGADLKLWTRRPKSEASASPTSSGELDAVKAHLADMRCLVFKEQK